MPENPSSPEPQDEAPRKKSPTKSAKPAKTAKKEIANEEAPAEKSNTFEKVEDAPQSEIAAHPEKSQKAAGGDTDSHQTRPEIKRGVRGTKKGAAKKSDKPPKRQDGKPKEANKNDSGDRSSKEAQRKQGRRGRNRNRQDQPQQEEPRVQLNPKKTAKRAWKIFLGEVNEEGLALIADKDAHELARRSLRVAEIYSREEALSLQQGKKKKVAEKVENDPKPSEKSEPSDDQ